MLLIFELPSIYKDKDLKIANIKKNKSILLFGLASGIFNISLDKNLKYFKKKLCEKTKIESDISINFLSIYPVMIFSSFMKNFLNDKYLKENKYYTIDDNYISLSEDDKKYFTEKGQSEEKQKRHKEASEKTIESIATSLESLFLIHDIYESIKN